MDSLYVDSFVMVADSGSMAEAARRLHLTPTALAQRVRALERELGVPLVARSGRFVHLTEAGERFLVRARRFQQEVRELKASARDDGFPGGLRIGTIRSALTSLLPDLLRAVAELCPQLDAAIEIGASHDLYHLLADGDVHAALMVAPPFEMPKSFVWHPLRVEPLVMLAPAAWACDDAWEMLRTRPFIRYDRRTWGGLQADQYLRRSGLQPQERFELDSPDGIQRLVALGLGTSLVPDCFPEELLLPEVIKVALPGAPLSRHIGLLWPVASPYGRLFNTILSRGRQA